MSRKLWNALEVATLELLFRQLTDAEDVLLTYLEKARGPVKPLDIVLEAETPPFESAPCVFLD